MTNDNDEYYDDDFEYDAQAEDDSPDLRPCPECGAEIYEDSEQCPICGNYITFGSLGPWSGRPLWWIILGAVGVVALIAALLSWSL